MGHYFINDDQLKDKRKKIITKVLNQEFIFYTDSGVFSRNYLDFGTKLLIETIGKTPLKGKLLDVGCGYGPIGIVLAKIADIEVDMVDINNRALQLAKENAHINGVQNVSIFASNIYDNIKDEYNIIITNPPIRAGKKVVYEILEKAQEYLTADGELWLVIRKQQGAESLIKYFTNIYKISIMEKTKGYFVVKAIK